MNSIVAHVYISSWSLSQLQNSTSVEELNLLIEQLEQKIAEFKKSRNIRLESSNDFLSNPILDSRNIEDMILSIVQNDWGAFQSYWNDIERIITQYIGNNPTVSLISMIQNQDPKKFPQSYPLSNSKEWLWPDLHGVPHVFSWSDLLNKNSVFIANNHSNKQEFIAWSKLNYENLEFHLDVESTLDTIQVGTYNNYKCLISHALNTLNQAYYIISTDANKNQEDLLIIANLSEKLGKKLECSRQGNNKQHWKFPTPTGVVPAGDETINCEYHLKIDTNDVGNAIPYGIGNNIRIYFGLKSYTSFPKKQLKIAHIGKHL